jgi:hypothetical protein
MGNQALYRHFEVGVEKSEGNLPNGLWKAERLGPHARAAPRCAAAMGGESETLNAEGSEKFKTGKLAEALALFTRVRARA